MVPHVLTSRCRSSATLPDEGRMLMNYLEDGGGWQERFEFPGGLGCAFMSIGFVLFLVAVHILRQRLF
jgi:hypothetical protein